MLTEKTELNAIFMSPSQETVVGTFTDIEVAASRQEARCSGHCQSGNCIANQ